jgi:hypothetical protein
VQGAVKAFSEDEYQSCSGEEIAIIYRYGEKIDEDARANDDGAAVPVIVWGRATVRRAVKPTALAGGV